MSNRFDPFSKNNVVKLAKAATAAGTGDTLSTSVIDTAGYAGCAFIVTFGAITANAVVTIKANQGEDSGLSDTADIEGSAISVADDDDGQTFVVDINQPTDRYVRLQITRATANAVVGEIYAILYGPRSLPKDMSATDLVTVETHIAAAEGTA